jgi:hypothetical protein
VKIEKDGNDSLSIEHKEETQVIFRKLQHNNNNNNMRNWIDWSQDNNYWKAS